MGDDVKFGVTGVRYRVLCDDGAWSRMMELGESASFDIVPTEDEASAWSDAILALPTCDSFTLKIDWWQSNRIAKVFGGMRVPYTVGRLRRYGKSHRRRRVRKSVL